MSNEMLDVLENKVFSAIETIELLRVEINELKEERSVMERKVRDLIQRIEGAEASAGATAITAARASTIDAGSSSTYNGLSHPLGKTGTNL